MQDITTRALIDRVLDGYGRLVEVGEQVEDEWQYVTDLSTVWRGRLEGVAVSRSSELAPAAAIGAVDAALDEIALISDPNRAIDWLSTFPQVILAALGEAG